MSYVPLSGTASNFGCLTYIVSAVTHRTRGPRKYHDEEIDMAYTGSMDQGTNIALADAGKIIGGLVAVLGGVAAVANFAALLGGGTLSASPK